MLAPDRRPTCDVLSAEPSASIPWSGLMAALTRGAGGPATDGKRRPRQAAAITPVPGGVGPVTVAMLLRNTVLAAEGMPPPDDPSQLPLFRF